MASAAEQLAANLNFGAFSKATELKKRLWFTLGVLIVYRLGTFIPIPGIDPTILAELFNAQRGGILENVFMRNVEIGQVAEAVLTIDLIYEEGAKGPHRPIVRNVQLEKVNCRASPRVMWIAAFEGAVVTDISFTDCTFRGVTQTDLVNHAGAIRFNRVTIEPAKKSRSLNSVPETK